MEERPLVVGAVATHPDSVQVWDALRAHFLRVGAPMDYALYSTADRLSGQLLAGAVDVAHLPALTFVQARARAGAMVVPVLIGDLHRDLRSHLVVRAGSALDLRPAAFSPSSLRGRSIAVGASDDAEQSFLPLFHLGAEGAPRGEIRLLRAEVDVGKGGESGAGAEAVLAAVREGRVDAGTIGDRRWRGVDPAGLTVIWTSPPADGPVFCALASGPTGLRRDFERAMRSFTGDDPARAAILARCGVTAWVTPREGGHRALQLAMAESSGW